MTKINTIIDFPNERIEFAGEDNPVFVTDTLNATESIITAMDNICGFPASGFRILSGFVLSAGVWSAGVFWLDGKFYFAKNGVTAGNVLRPNIDGQFSKLFGDANSRYTYTVYLATDEASPTTGDSPVFGATADSMDSYRMTLEIAKTYIDRSKISTALTDISPSTFPQTIASATYDRSIYIVGNRISIWIGTTKIGEVGQYTSTVCVLLPAGETLEIKDTGSGVLVQIKTQTLG